MRQKDNNFQRRRDDINKHYHRLRNAAVDSRPFPFFGEFLRLPSMQSMLFNPEAGKHILRRLKYPDTTAALQKDLVEWEQSRSQKLSGILGFDDWQGANDGELHPTKRWTARFRCKACDAARPGGCFDDAGLSYVEVCNHSCVYAETEAPEGKGEYWNIDQFEADTKVRIWINPRSVCPAGVC